MTGTELRAYLPTGVAVSTISNDGTQIGAGEVVWNVGSMNAGAVVNRQVSVTADSVSEGDILKLAAELTHDGGMEDDNRNEFSVTVTQSGTRADLMSFEITATPDPVAANGDLAYTITLTNNYGLPLDGVTVLLRMPGDMSFRAFADAEPDIYSCGADICDGVE